MCANQVFYLNKITRKMGFDGVYPSSSASKGSNNVRILSRSVGERIRSASDEGASLSVNDHAATY